MIHVMVGLLAVTVQTPVPDLPVPVTNNAVASVEIGGRWHAYSFLGLDPTKRWSGVHTRSFAWVEGQSAWTAIPSPPGPGRLAGTAQVGGGRVFLFGGYTVAEDGSEKSVPNVDIWDPRAGRWSRGADIPVPTDDAVSGIWRDSLIYLVSGWHDRDNVANVQIYDPAADRWQQGTPIPGTPVFGHTGGIAGDVIVYVDGTGVFPDERPRFRLVHESWRGVIDPANPTRITWTRLPDHPGPAVYRGAGIGEGPTVRIAGGSGNAYNYNGIGYDRNPTEPHGAWFEYDVVRNAWVTTRPIRPITTMDHRGLVRIGDGLYTIGGMEAGQRVTGRVEKVGR